MFLSGGRESFGVGFSSEVWRSADEGVTWEIANKKAFPSRAYHVHIVVDDCMIVSGGQTFLSFYNDVWKSCDGKGEVWEKIVDKAPFAGR